MRWIPIGPGFAFSARRPYKRLSRRNEWGTQGQITEIVFDPTDPNIIYVVARAYRADHGLLFRSRDGGASWTPISDGLPRTNIVGDALSVAVNPRRPQTIYLATGLDQGFYV